MTTNFRALCAELLADYEEHLYRSVLADKARAALAEPPPRPPTIMEIIELADEIEADGLGQVDLVRAALARWGGNSQPTNHSAHITALRAAVDEVVPEAPEPTPDALGPTVDFGYAWAVWDASQSIRKKFNALIDKLH